MSTDAKHFSAVTKLFLAVGFALCVTGCVVESQSTQLAGTGGVIEGGNGAPADDNRRFEVRLQLAAAYYQGARYDVALEEVNKALDLRPRSPDALSLKGMIYQGQGDTVNALSFFQQAVKAAPDNGDFLHNYGVALCDNGRVEPGIGYLQQAIAQPAYQRKSNSFTAIGVCYVKAGDVVAAESAFRQALALEPQNSYALYQMGSMMFNRNDVQGAKYYFNQLASFGNLNAQTLWLGIKIARQEGDAYGMSQLARTLRERYPNSPERAALERGDFNL